MTHPTPNGASASRLIVPFQFSDFAVSWAGPGGRDEDFCFGSEDGRLHFTTVEGRPIGGFVSGEEDPEAVNGVAFIGPVIAVSTRNEITFWTLPRPGSRQAQRAVFPCGSHGVISTAEGYFVAPLGPTGLMKVRAGHEENQPVTVSRATDRTFDFYKVISLHSYGRPEMLASAARFGGLVATEFVPEGERRGFCSMTFPGLDVVDVCSLGTGTLPAAVAAVGRNGTLVLSRNVLSDPSPVTMKFDDIPGVAYRVLSARGSIFLLTSVGLFLLSGLARRFLAGEPIASTPTPVRGIPLEAVDANVCGDRWLLVVMPNEVLRLDLELFMGNVPPSGSLEAQREVHPTQLRPTWEAHEEAAELMTVQS